MNDLSSLTHLVTGQIGKVGEDYVEGGPTSTAPCATSWRSRRADGRRPDPRSTSSRWRRR
jgi:hypothetical protein